MKKEITFFALYKSLFISLLARFFFWASSKIETWFCIEKWSKVHLENSCSNDQGVVKFKIRYFRHTVQPFNYPGKT